MNHEQTAKVTRIGMLTPSSNTVLEPMTAALFHGVSNISAHFARLRVTEITVSDSALAQFNSKPMLEAASLLSDARPHAILWNGTSGGWRGFEADRRIRDELRQEFGVPVSTVTLALVDLLNKRGFRRIAFVTPYTVDIQECIIANFSAAGFDCVATPCLGISENFAFSEVPAEAMTQLVEETIAARPEVIIPFCTNLAATRSAPIWEARYGVPVFDSIAVAARAGLELAGLSPNLIRGWGSIFES